MSVAAKIAQRREFSRQGRTGAGIRERAEEYVVMADGGENTRRAIVAMETGGELAEGAQRARQILEGRENPAMVEERLRQGRTLQTWPIWARREAPRGGGRTNEWPNMSFLLFLLSCAHPCARPAALYYVPYKSQRPCSRRSHHRRARTTQTRLRIPAAFYYYLSESDSASLLRPQTAPPASAFLALALPPILNRQ